MAVLQVPFGRRADGRLMEVSQVKRGLACGCFCPGCGERLLAKKGEVNVQHFAHLPGSDCATGAETALHLAAKQLIADERWLNLPPLVVEVSRLDPEFGRFTARQVYGHRRAWRFDRVELELAVGTIRPDAVGFVGEGLHGVEIRVTHQVDADKRNTLAQLGLPSIEVDLSKEVGRIFTFEALSAVVLTAVDNKHWLFHPEQAKWKDELLSGFDAWRSAQEQLALASDHRTVFRMAPAAPVAKPEPKDKFRAANERYRRSTTEAKWTRLESELGLPRDRFPRHLGVALREGAGVVQAEDALWQGALFSKFVLGEGAEDRQGTRMPSERSLSEWLAQRFGVKGGDEAARPAVRSYLGYLRACGFLRKQGFDFYVEHSGLHPPPRLVPKPAPAPITSIEPPLPWKKVWPDYDRLSLWATEMSKSCSGFDAARFVGWLWNLDAPPTPDESRRAFGLAAGKPEELVTVLRGMGVLDNTWRHFSYGEPAPWLDD